MDTSQPKLTDLWIEVNGLRTYARVCTSAAGPPVVLVHGLGVSGTYLVPTAERLAAYYPTYVPDLPGFGKTAKPDHILKVPELSDALAAWMKAVGVADACLLGNSMGCQTIIDLALRYPELAHAAVLVGPTIDSHARRFWTQIGRGFRDMFREPLRFWPLLTWDYLKAGTVRTLRTLRYALDDPVAEKLPHVKIPVLVVRGNRDPIAPEPWAEEMVRLLPRGRLLVIPGAAHVANYTAGDQLAAAVRDFMETSFPVLAGSAETK